MSRITVEISGDILESLELSVQDLRLAAAMKLFEIGRLSSGAAAELAEIPRAVFLSKLADYRVPAMDFTEDEFDAESRLERTRV